MRTGERVSQLERPLPQNQDAERSVLGAILLDNHALNAAIENVKPADFFLDQHRRIFRRMIEMRSGIDLVTLSDQLHRDGELEAAGGAAYIAQLVDGVPRVYHVEHYAKAVKTTSLERQAIHLADLIKQRKFDGEDVRDLIAKLTDVETQASTRSESSLKLWAGIPDVLNMKSSDIGFHIPGILPAGAVILISGLPGTHKTNLEMAVGWCASEGRNFIGRNTKKGTVLVLDRENPLHVIASRMRLLGIKPSEFFKWWGMWCGEEPPLIGDPRLLAIARDLKPLMFFDSFIRFTGDCREDDASEIKTRMEAIRQLATAGAMPVLLHHAPWSWASGEGGKFFRGSVDILAACDLAFSITADGNDDGLLTLAVEKTRYSERFTLRLRAPDFSVRTSFESADMPASTPVDALVTWVQQQGGETTRETIKKQRGRRRSAWVALIDRAVSDGKLVSGPRGRISVPDLGTGDFPAFVPDVGTDGNGNG